MNRATVIAGKAGGYTKGEEHPKGQNKGTKASWSKGTERRRRVTKLRVPWSRDGANRIRVMDGPSVLRRVLGHPVKSPGKWKGAEGVGAWVVMHTKVCCGCAGC
jgi:hypothetical protein